MVEEYPSVFATDFKRLGVSGMQARVPKLEWSVIDLYPDTGIGN